ncbi:A/G-specific adenine glycosylase [Candidatus Phycosocius spiralis]|uniref:Adenine DNA glycosylase n=1 Tax=Candidatus Phycosocius spiralis TaxID=2815099 RepID=A0ABQ4PWF2_9PROT|nr:A/G-specific adenine glycosylase [Candidatus Phycosocius spiralis]GIU67333.1 A/G-specific adenine glycosylase [Candidatus Phycosocius spiralis]
MAHYKSKKITQLREQLLAWYDRSARDLPWRLPPAQGLKGQRPDPYAVWLSEIMLQQTGVATVKTYYVAFINRFPTVQDLAKAPLDDVLALWAGLGYYRRAHHLHAAAKDILARGGVPTQPQTLQKIQGIGPYTAAAIAAIAFDQPVVPVDGNVERVLSRLWLIEAILPAAKPIFWHEAQAWMSTHRPGDFAQALMDLGATICTPRTPACNLCPWQSSCGASKQSRQGEFPKKQVNKKKPTRYGTSWVHIDPDGVLVTKRAHSGLLGGMLEVPSTSWGDDPSSDPCLGPVDLPKGVTWLDGGYIDHVFTHFALRVRVFSAYSPKSLPVVGYQRLGLDALAGAALPSLMHKIIVAGRSILAAQSIGLDQV